jgi:hypothetical protein
MSTHGDTEKPAMTVFWIILFGFLLFCIGLVVWIIGIAIRIYEWTQRRREPPNDRDRGASTRSNMTRILDA